MLILVLWQRVVFLCVSHRVFRMSLVMVVRRVLCSVRLAMYSLSVLNCNFSKEQYMLPEDDRVIETCRSVLSVLM